MTPSEKRDTRPTGGVLQATPIFPEESAKLSIVVIGSEPPDVVASCVDSLRPFGTPGRVEIAVLNPQSGESLMQTRSRAAAAAQCEFIVFLNPRYRLTDGWTQAMLNGHASGSSVVGGCVTPAELAGNAAAARGRSIYLWEYAGSALAADAESTCVDPERARSFPGGNTSYQTNLLRRYDIGRYANEMDFHSALAAAGVNLRQKPEAAVIYVPPPMKDHFLDVFRVARNYSASRGQSAVPGILHAGIALFLLMPYLLVKNSLRVWRNPAWRSSLSASLPWFAIFATVQTAGAIAGYLRPAKTRNRSW